MERKIKSMFPEGVEVQPGHDEFFEQLKVEFCNGNITVVEAEKIKSLALKEKSKIQSKSWDFSTEKYVRNYIGKAENGLEAIVMGWSKDLKSSIHGHPKFAMYAIITGELEVEIFEFENKIPVLKQTVAAKEGDVFYNIGDSENFDNHLHRISCKSDTSLSLHIYSDDAREGVVYYQLD
jgi:hypothetical protein